jgi:hypothetical protein
LRLFTIFKSGNSDQLRGRYHALAAAAMNADLKHGSSLDNDQVTTLPQSGPEWHP